MNRFVITVVGAGLLCLPFLAACGDDDAKTDTPTAASDATKSVAGGTTPDSQPSATKAATTAASSPTAAPTTGGGNGQVTGSGADALKALAKDLSSKTYQVSYDIQIMSNGKTSNVSLSLAQKPPKSVTAITAAAGIGTFTVIDDGTNTLTCTKDPTGTTGQCVKSKSDASNPLNASLFSLSKTLDGLTANVNVAETTGRSIAGIDSRCFTIKEASSGDSTGCFSKSDGIMTYVETKATDGTATKLQATKVSTSVDDSIFAAPAGFRVIDSPAR